LEGEARNPGASFANAHSSPGHPTLIFRCDKPLVCFAYRVRSTAVCLVVCYASQSSRNKMFRQHRAIVVRNTPSDNGLLHTPCSGRA